MYVYRPVYKYTVAVAMYLYIRRKTGKVCNRPTGINSNNCEIIMTILMIITTTSTKYNLNIIRRTTNDQKQKKGEYGEEEKKLQKRA